MSSGRILIIGKFPYPAGAAASMRVHNLARGFLEAGCEVDVVTFGVASSDNYEGLEGLSYEARHIPSSGMIGAQWANYIAPLRMALDLKELLSERKYRAAYVYGRALSITGPIVAVLRKHKLFVINDINEVPSHFHGIGGYLNPNYWNGWFGYHWVAKWSNLIAGITTEICSYYERSSQCETYCMPSIEIYDQVPSAFPSEDRTAGPELLYMGAMFERDCPEWMLSVLGRVAERGVPFRLHMIGNYRARRDSEQILGKAYEEYPSLKDRIDDHGRVSEEMLCELMNRCVGGFVLRRDHASERGSFPTRLAELLRAERVVISSYVPDVPRYLNHDKDSILLEQHSIHEDAAVLESYLLNHSKLEALSVAGREQGSRVLNARIHAQNLLNLLPSI